MKDKISTNTNLVVFNREREMRTMQQLVPLYAENGLNILDLNFCEMMNPVSSLKDKDKAKSYIESLKRYKSELGLEYIQCHLPYKRNGESLEDFNNELFLALEYVETLEISVSVIHPIKANIEQNIEYFESIKSYVPSSTTLAIENMETFDEIHSVKDLLAIIEKLSYKAGICLDTGHANIMKEDIPSFIEKAGGNLIATHIADNNAKEDQHFLPGFGNIEWEKVVPALKKSYKGYINYEAMFFSRNLPEMLSKEIIELAKSIGSWLLSL